MVIKKPIRFQNKKEYLSILRFKDVNSIKRSDSLLLEERFKGVTIKDVVFPQLYFGDEYFPNLTSALYSVQNNWVSKT